jgi:hypothetical protein
MRRHRLAIVDVANADTALDVGPLLRRMVEQGRIEGATGNTGGDKG